MQRIKPYWQKVKARSGLLMAGCCVLLVGGGAGRYFLGLTGNWALYGLIFLCPLLHLLFMKDHHH